jgi:hypothetical protein
VLKDSSVVFFPNLLPEKEDDACILSLLLPGFSLADHRNPILDAAFLKRD